MRLLLVAFLVLGAVRPALAGLTESQLAGVGIDPPSAAAVPLDLALQDEADRQLTLGTALAGRPAILLLADYTCTTLCGTATDVTAGELAALSLRPGADYQAFIVGLDPKDGRAEAAAARTAALAADPTAAALRFLSAAPADIAALTRSLGYRYAYDAEHDQFAHPAGLFVLAADGRLVRVLAGLGPAPRDLELALVEAGEGRGGTLADRVRLLCYGYDAAHGVYTASIERLLAVAAALTLALLAACLILLRRRERRLGAG